MAGQFECLFTPLEIRNVTIRNRVLMTAHNPSFKPMFADMVKRVKKHGACIFQQVGLTPEMIEIEEIKDVVERWGKGDDLTPGGLGVEERQEVARIISGTGKIDYITVKAVPAGRRTW